VNLRLPTDVYSPDQLGIVLWELDALISRLRDAATRSAVKTADGRQDEIHVSTFLIGVLHTMQVSPGDRAALEQLQSALQAARENAPVAHFVLPVPPNRALKRQLIEWFRTEVDAQSLVTFATRGDIGGGFILRMGSKQYDFTFRARLLENRQRIGEMLPRV